MPQLWRSPELTSPEMALLAHGRGDVLADDGTPVASYAQEALLRFATCGSQIYCPPTVLEDNQVANECEAGILEARSV
jgi:hypothetical protein